MTQNTKYILILVVAAVLILIDYSSVIYYKIFSMKGQWPEFYQYNISSGKLLEQIESLNENNYKVSIIPNGKTDFVQVSLLEKSTQNYTHFWISTSNQEQTTIVFGCVGENSDFKLCDYVNVDFDHLNSYFFIKKFENEVLDKLNLGTQ